MFSGDILKGSAFRHIMENGTEREHFRPVTHLLWLLDFWGAT
jgi:hypothetical protein